MARRRKRTSSGAVSRQQALTQQAGLESQLRYGEKSSVLQQLLQQAGQQFQTSLSGSLEAARGISQAAREGRATSQADYGQATNRLGQDEAFVASQLAKLGAGADPVRAAAANEGGISREILSRTLGSALTDLNQRQQNAPVAALYAINKAIQQYGGQSDKITQQLQQIAGEQGAFAAERSDQLNQQARQEDITLRGQTLSHADRVATARESRRQHQASQDLAAASLGETTRHHIATETNAAKSKAHGKSLTPEQTSKRISAIRQAQSLANNLIRQGGHSKADAANMLTQGFSVPQRVGGKTTTRTIKAIDAALAQAGVELATQGRIGAGTARRLRKEQHLNVSGKLPVMSAAQTRSYRDRLKARRKTASKIPGISGAARS